MNLHTKAKNILKIGIATGSVLIIFILSSNVSNAITGDIRFDKSSYCAGVGGAYNWWITSDIGSVELHGTKNGVEDFSPFYINTPFNGSGTFGPSDVGNYVRYIHGDDGFGNHVLLDSISVNVNNCPGPVCSPSSQTVNVNPQGIFTSVNFNATGGDGNFSWSAPDGAPSTGTGSNFNTAYNIPINYSSPPVNKTVTVNSAGKQSACNVEIKQNAYIYDTYFLDGGYKKPVNFWWLPAQADSSFLQVAEVNLNDNNEKLSDGKARYFVQPAASAGGTNVCTVPGVIGPLLIYGSLGQYTHTYSGDFYKGSRVNNDDCSLNPPPSTIEDIGTQEKEYKPFLGIWTLQDKNQGGKGVHTWNFNSAVYSRFAQPDLTTAKASMKSYTGNLIKVTINGSNADDYPANGDSNRLYLNYSYQFIDNGVAGSWSSKLTTNSRARYPDIFSVDQDFTCQNGRKVQFKIENGYNKDLDNDGSYDNRMSSPAPITRYDALTNQVDLSCTGIGYPPGAVVDIKADNLNGPITLSNGSSANLTWTSSGGTSISCTASGNWSGSRAANNAAGESTGSLSGSASYIYALNCTNSEGGSGSDSVTVNVSGPTLDTTLGANPISGLEPLASTLTSTVSGSATGTITYKFDCDNNGTYEGTYTSSSNTQNHVCTYYWSNSNNGKYTARVRVERQGLAIEKTIPVTANQQTLTCNLSANPSSGNSPLKPDITITVGGTAVGTINYTFWKNCAYTGTNVQTGISQCGNPDKKIDGSSNTSETFNMTYSQVGTNTAKAICERGVAAPAQNTQTINVLNNKPVASNVTVREPDYCFSGPTATVEWTYSDPENDPQSAYQIQIDDKDSFNSPEHDSGKVICNTCRSNYSGTGKFDFNKTYQARVRVWDSNDLPSDWTKMTLLCSSAGICQAATNWKPPKHTFPTASVDLFTWIPQEVTIKKEVQFTDNAKCFNDKGDQENCKIWNWNFGDSSTSTQQNPKHTYTGIKTYTASETVVDKDEYSCSASQSINVSDLIPEFKEVPPAK